MIDKDNVLYVAANLIAITSKDSDTKAWISKKERAYLVKIANHENINYLNGKLDLDLIEYYNSSTEKEEAVIKVLKTCDELVKMKAVFYMEEMADVDLEDGDQNASDRESARINRVELGCDFNRAKYVSRKPSLDGECIRVNG